MLPRLFKRERPGGRLLLLEGHAHAEQPIMLTEFGGIAFSRATRRRPGATRACETAEEFAKRYTHGCWRWSARCRMLAGFCYTQFADTYQEANGLLYADRTPKFPIEQIALATRGSRPRRRPSAQSPRSSTPSPRPTPVPARPRSPSDMYKRALTKPDGRRF